MQLKFETFTPSEAEDISMLPQATVRNWRRAGYLPRPKGHARYSVVELLVQLAMQALVARGVKPEVASAYSGELARAIFQSLLLSDKAYSERAVQAAFVAVDAVPDHEAARLNAIAGTAFSADEIREINGAKHLRDSAERSFGLSGLKCPAWLIIWANGEMQFYYDEDISEETFFGNTTYDDYVKGPVILFCLGAMAQMILDRLPRPPITLAEEG